MNQNTNPDAVFGPDTTPVSSPDFRSIAEQIRGVDVRALTNHQQMSDVITMIDYMRAETVKLYDETIAREQELNAREKDLERRERDVELKLRVFNSASQTKKLAGSRLARYFRG